MNVVLFGATGMVGQGVLLECLDAPEVESVLVIGRRKCGVIHPKVTELILNDLFAIDSVRDSLATCDACFYCLGVSSVGMSEAEYQRVTYELTMKVARTLRAVAPRAVFLFVSGAGTQTSERSRSMWARVKGKTENDLFALGFGGAHMFRPGFIQPLRGVRSKTAMYQLFYTIAAPLIPMLRRLAPGMATTTVAVGRAMIRVAAHGTNRKVLRNWDINDVAAQVGDPSP